jgi:hypothetical protein
MGEVSDKPAVAEEILAEHRRIRDIAKEIQATTDLAELLGRLGEFRAVLERHFAAEEASDGFYDTMRVAAPRHIVRIDRLTGEHPVFLADVDRLMDRIRVCLAARDEIHREATGLTRRLWDHETREDGLLLDTIYIDLGQGDG